jgi:hypothetical protein
MTEGQEATDRKVKWLRYSAWGLAVAWAGYWTLWYGLMMYGCATMGWEVSAAYWPIVATMILASWLVVATPRRWPRAGAALLLAATFLVPYIAFYGFVYTWGYGEDQMAAVNHFLGVCVGLVPLYPLLAAAAASLFLLSWRMSSTPAHPQATE